MAVQNQKANEDLFDAYFRRADLDGDGQISGAEAVAFFQGSNLPKHVLAQVWMHADQKKLSYLGRAEFYNALKLVTVAQSKRELTPDMVKAALYGPASAKIPAPQINLAATPAPQSKAAAPVAQAVGATSAPSQSTGIGRPQNVGHASTNQQYFSSQQSQLNRSPQAMPPVVPPQPQQALASQGISSGATMATPHPPNSTLSTGWLAGSTGGSLGGVNSQIPNRSINSSVNQEAFGLTASGLTSAAQPRPQVAAGKTFSMPPKSQDPAKPSNQLADKDAKALVVSGNGFASDSLFGDVFATSQPKQNPSAATTSTSGSSISSMPAQASLKPPLESFQSTVIQHPAGLQQQQSVSTVKPAPHISSQSTTSSSSTGFSVGAGNSASSESSQSMPWPKMTPADVQKYTKVFMQVDSDRDGKITGEQARNLFLSWRLPREVLKQVWDLSDQDNDSMLSLKEFCIALYLMERYREGRPLPTMLPSTIMPSETLFTGTGQPTASYGSASWGPMHGFQQPQVPSASRPPSAARGKPPRPVPSSHGDGAIQSGNQKPKVPVLEKHLVDQLSKEEQDSLNTKFQEATAVNKKVEELEKEIAESKQKIEFCRVKMQELVLYKSRCDNRLNEIMERVSADKREVESLAKKYEEKYKQSGDVASRLTIEEATFRDIQEKKMELYQAIVKIEDGDTANGVLKERAERIESGLEELIKAVNERCKQYGLRAKPTSLVELPFGWQPGIQEAAADWDENWDKFDNEEFTFVKELTLDVENVIAPPKPKSSSSQNETAPSTDESSNISSSNLDDKLEKVPSTGENIPEKELASEQGDVLERTPPGSPAGSSAVENQPQGLQDSNHVKSSDADGSPHAKGTRSDHVPAESAVSGDKSFDEPSWGTFDTHYDTDSVWAFDQDFSSKHCPRQTLNLLRRFGPSKRTQSCGYATSSRQDCGKPGGNPVTPIETQASPSWGTYVIPAAVLGFAGIVTFIHYNDERRAVPKGQGNRSISNTTTGPIIGGPFTLVDTENRLVTEQNFLGNWVLLYFGYTSSPDVGPEQVQIMAKATDILESKQGVKVLPVFITIDPQRDTPAQLRAYLKEFDPRLVGLTGPVGAVRQMAQEYRVYFKKVEEEGDDYLVESSHNMYLMNPKMEVVRCFGTEYSSEELSEAILREVSGSRK